MKVWHVKLQKGPCKNIVWLIMNRCCKKKIRKLNEMLDKSRKV